MPSQPHRAAPPPHAGQRRAAVVFDMDGVLTDTADLHYQSWKVVTDELGIAFDRRTNDEMRGRSRPESVAVLLRGRESEFDAAARTRIMARKNEAYLRLVERMTPADLAPGVAELIAGLRAAGVRLAVASSSRNATAVLERLGIRVLLDVLVDANQATRSKPDPQVFLEAAAQLGVPAARCVAVEDGEAGVEAGLAAGMMVVGIGPAERVGRAHLIISSMRELTAQKVLDLLGA